MFRQGTCLDAKPWRHLPCSRPTRLFSVPCLYTNRRSSWHASVGTPVSSLTPLIGSTLPHSHATQTSYGATDFYIIRHNFSFVQSRPFWFIPLDTAMIAEPKYIYQVFVKQKIKTIRRVEAKERKRNLYTTFLLSLLLVTFIK